jgi:hypothetical protein
MNMKVTIRRLIELIRDLTTSRASDKPYAPGRNGIVKTLLDESAYGRDIKPVTR